MKPVKTLSKGQRMKKVVLVVILMDLLALPGCSYKSMQKFTLKTDHLVNVVKKPPEVANYARDVVWASPGGENLLLDVSWPAGEGPYPIVVNIHGGAFFLDTKAIDEALCRYLTNRGYTVFNINYRLAPQHQFPAAVNDSLGAVIWAKAHSREYKGDPSRVAVSGGSAGGNLVGMVALAWDDPFFTPTFTAPGLDASVQAAVAIFAVWDMTTMSHPGDKGENPYLGATIEGRRDLFEKASPIFYLDRKSIPPMMLVCGDKDGLYPQSEKVAKILQGKGVPSEFYTAHGKGHAFTNWHWQAEAQKAYAAIGDWLDQELK
jgi:acetyl esterase